MTANTSSQLITLLEQLSEMLIELQLSSATQPSEEAMGSQAPFACDSMELADWLQYIFIPKMHALIQQNGTLPGKMAISPIAEYHYGQQTRYAKLIQLIAKIDARCNSTQVQ